MPTPPFILKHNSQPLYCDVEGTPTTERSRAAKFARRGGAQKFRRVKLYDFRGCWRIVDAMGKDVTDDGPPAPVAA